MRLLVLLCSISVSNAYSSSKGLIQRPKPANVAAIRSDGAPSPFWLSSPAAAVALPVALPADGGARVRGSELPIAEWLGRAARRSASPVATMAAAHASLELLAGRRFLTIGLIAFGMLRASWRWVSETITES
jgi:hypothetical protein